MVDGRIVGAAQEERFSGIKGDYGYPEKAVRACLDGAGARPGDIAFVALASKSFNPVLTRVKRHANFSVDDWVKEQHQFWRPRLFDKRPVNYYSLFKDRRDFAYDKIYATDHLLSGYMDPTEMEQAGLIRRQTVAAKLQVAQDKLVNVTHEDCHTYYSYFASPLRGDVLALTSEGIGDYSNGTVSTFSERGRSELSRTRDNHLGHIFKYITLLLGMRPEVDEYKVMGLAPYATPGEVAKSMKVFEKILKLDGLDVVYDERPDDLYFHFRSALEGHRFDGIAGAVQRFLEQVLSQWVSACIEQTGLDRVVFSGGVAQNVKAVGKLLDLDAVREIFVCPAAGDTSLSIGACQYVEWSIRNAEKTDIGAIRPLDHAYLGPRPDAVEVRRTLLRRGTSDRFDVHDDVTADQIADRLARGRIVGRCVDRMEFGSRALGNRSILADPRNPQIVGHVNRNIKARDFWMPFAPTILDSFADAYLVDRKGSRGPFMTIAYETTARARREIPAALHAADLTARPQILARAHNPAYYDIIEAFQRRTGVGALLNTSLNLHGSPIALGADEALDTFENSDLDDLILDKVLVSRRPCSWRRPNDETRLHPSAGIAACRAETKT